MDEPVYDSFELLRDSGTSSNGALFSDRRSRFVSSGARYLAPNYVSRSRFEAIPERRSKHAFDKRPFNEYQEASIRTTLVKCLESVPENYLPFFRVTALFRNRDGELLISNDINGFDETKDSSLGFERTDLFIQPEFDQFSALIVPWVSTDNLVRNRGLVGYMDLLVVAGRYLEAIWLDVLRSDVFACMIAGIVKQGFARIVRTETDTTPLAGLVLGNDAVDTPLER